MTNQNLKRIAKLRKGKICEFKFNPSKNTAQIFDRDGNNLFSLDKTEATFLAEQILKNFKWQIN